MSDTQSQPQPKAIMPEAAKVTAESMSTGEMPKTPMVESTAEILRAEMEAKITKADIIEYYTNVIEKELPYTKTYSIKHPLVDDKDFKITLQTKTAHEATFIVHTVQEHSIPGRPQGLTITSMVSDLNLACSLVSVDGRKYDEGIDRSAPVKEWIPTRIGLINKMPQTKKSIVLETLASFDLWVSLIERKFRNF